jgi:hypothetical protein
MHVEVEKHGVGGAICILLELTLSFTLQQELRDLVARILLWSQKGSLD